MKHFLPEEELIEYVKPYLKAKGFKKKNKRWTKNIGKFTLCFYIQGIAFLQPFLSLTVFQRKERKAFFVN